VTIAFIQKEQVYLSHEKNYQTLNGHLFNSSLTLIIHTISAIYVTIFSVGRSKTTLNSVSYNFHKNMYV